MNIKEIAISRKSRKGQAHRITSDGAYWLALDIKINRRGGDGIGQNRAGITDYYRVRHYRSGEVRAYCETKSWHQNRGDSVNRVRCDQTLNAETIEDLIASIKRVPMDRWGDDFGTYSVELEIKSEIPELPISLPAPDEVT